MNKNAIQKYAVWARNELIEQIKQRAYQYGIDDKGYGDVNPAAIAGRVLSADERWQRETFVGEIKRKGYEQIIEEVAYTWFNRFIALRFMEVNDYLPSHTRVFSDANGAFNPEILTNVLHLNLPGLNNAKVSELINANATEDLYRYLLLTQCNALNMALPEMFERMGNYTEMLLPNNILRQDSVLARLVIDIPEDDWHNAVQIIGWMYQYYNTEPKQAVFDGLKKNIKITKDKIPAATQLFTPEWIVKYMVENSLGRIFCEKLLAVRGKDLSETERTVEEKKIADSMGWKYYLPEAEQTPEVRAQLIANHSSLATLNIEDIKIIDPCMGSGHILIYAFDVLLQIYRHAGYTDRHAAKLILEKNLHGLDIDRRAYQLAYFSLKMKARPYYRRSLDRGITPQVYHPAGWEDGEEFGSLLKVDDPGKKPDESLDFTLFDDFNSDLRVWNYKRLLSQKYDVVVTNPPYIGIGGMRDKLSDYLKINFPDSKNDIFASFIEQCKWLANDTGFIAMITMESWMFLTNFEKLRIKLLNENTIMNLIHLPYLGKGGTSLGINFGTSSFVIYNKRVKKFNSQYDCVRYYETNNESIPIEFPIRNERYLSTKSESFFNIQGTPIAYWASNAVFKCFSNFKTIKEYSLPATGTSTGNNDLFLRYWYEVSLQKIAIIKLKKSNSYKWFPCNKGGEYRKWYGVNEYIIDWENNGEKIKNYPNAYLRNVSKIFTPGLTWSKLGSSSFSIRYFPEGFICESIGCAIFETVININQILGFLNTNVASMLMYYINPTLGRQPGYIGAIPYYLNTQNEVKVTNIVQENIRNSRIDWDSYEFSWDFKRHPLV